MYEFLPSPQCLSQSFVFSRGHCGTCLPAGRFKEQKLQPVPVTISQNIQSGEPVFTNTRVPVKNLFDYLKAGHSLNEFLEDFPSVKKKNKPYR